MKTRGPAAAPLTPRSATTSTAPARVLSPQMARAGPRTGHTKYPNNPNKLSPEPTSTYPNSRTPIHPCDEQSRHASGLLGLVTPTPLVARLIRATPAQLGRTLPRRAFGPALFA